MMKRSVSAGLVALFSIMTFSIATLATSSAGTRIIEPRGNPYHVALDATGKPVAFTVAASGFPAGHLVFVEQCNGRPTSAAHWAVTLDCDPGNAPAPAIVDGSGDVRFPAGDTNHGFAPVVGVSPSSLFNCMKSGDTPPKNGLLSYTTCQIRVSTNNTQSTDDQVFMPFVFGGSSSGGGSGSSVALVAVVAGVLIVAVAGVFVWRRRRAPARVA